MANDRVIYLEIDGVRVPIEVIREWRRSVRISIGKRCAFLRLPATTGRRGTEKHIRWATQWLTHQFSKDPSTKQRFVQRLYRSGDEMRVNGQCFRLDIHLLPRKTNTALVSEGTVFLKLNQRQDAVERHGKIPGLLSRAFSKYFIGEIRQRVETLNNRYFGMDIGHIRLKYNTSNWGSCSSAGNINLSSRLLFAPRDVQDYVIIHELAHLIEMNHSDRFWQIVRSVMPDYREKERWLKAHGHQCSF